MLSLRVFWIYFFTLDSSLQNRKTSISSIYVFESVRSPTERGYLLSAIKRARHVLLSSTTIRPTGISRTGTGNDNTLVDTHNKHTHWFCHIKIKGSRGLDYHLIHFWKSIISIIIFVFRPFWVLTSYDLKDILP